MSPLDIRLTDAERQSQTWISLKAKFEARLEMLRRLNDDPNLTAERTQALRGHIACLKEIISLDTAPPLQRPVPVASPFPRMRTNPGALNG